MCARNVRGSAPGRHSAAAAAHGRHSAAAATVTGIQFLAPNFERHSDVFAYICCGTAKRADVFSGRRSETRTFKVDAAAHACAGFRRAGPRNTGISIDIYNSIEFFFFFLSLSKTKLIKNRLHAHSDVTEYRITRESTLF